jgi:hypothetical protein
VQDGNWLNVESLLTAPVQVVQSFPFQACIDASGLIPGVYNATFIWNDEPQFTISFQAQLTGVAPPAVKMSPSTLSFSTVAGTDPAPQTVTVSNSGGGTLSWTSTTTANPWWTYSPNSASANTTPVTVQPHAASLGPGLYTGSIFVSDPSGAIRIQNEPDGSVASHHVA